MQGSNILFGEDGKLRSGWRFAAFVAVFILSYFFFLTALVTAYQSLGFPLGAANTSWYFTHNAGVLAITLILGWLGGKYLEGLPLEALGVSLRNKWLRNFLIGIAAGAFTFTLAAFVGMLNGGLSFSLNSEADFNSIISTLLISFLFFAVAAAFEEVLFRGYILQTFVRSDLSLFGIALTSVLFASVHNGNPSANLISWANTFLAGIWFGMAYLKTRDLWFVTGLHLAWNWTQGSIFGVEVSGLTDIVQQPLMRETDLGPTWLTGGNYGIEGGIATTVALLISIAAIKLIPFGTANIDGPSRS